MTLLEAQTEAQTILQLNPVFLHVKSTGDCEHPEVVEIAILDSSGDTLAEELVNPVRSIQPAATKEHGLTNEMVVAAPAWEEIIPKITRILEGRKVCVYDEVCEIKALRNSFLNTHHRWTLGKCTFYSLMDLFSHFKNQRDGRTGSLKTYPLVEAAGLLGIEIEVIAYRRASEDAWLVRALLLAIASWKAY